jgi:hypothetical protein
MKDHSLGVHFSYSTSLLLLHEHCATVKCAAIKVQLDLNDTRVAVQHGLFLSLIRMMSVLRMYLLAYTSDNAESSDNRTDAPYEPRVHGVHEGDLPRHPFVGIQRS